MENFERGSEWRQWDLHLHTATSFDYKYKASDSDEKAVRGVKKTKNSSSRNNRSLLLLIEKELKI